MKDVLLTTLRDASTPIEIYRQSADLLASLIAAESGQFLSKIKKQVKTPVGHAEGVSIQKAPILIPILRSGLVLLQAFTRLYPTAPIGLLGIRRDEKTATPHLYYEKLQTLHRDDLIFLLDPMIATGRSASLAVKTLENKGAQLSQIVLISILASPEGIAHFQKQFPMIRIQIVHIDEKLDPKKWIVPGVGDFGDRYFGT